MIEVVYSGGYLLSAITFLILSILFSFVPNKNVVTQALVYCCLSFAVWGIGNIWLFFFITGNYSLYFLALESIRLLGLLSLLLALLSVKPRIIKIFLSSQFITIALLLFISVCLLMLEDRYKQFSYTLLLAVTIFLLVLIETIFSKAKHKFWALKPMILGLFTMLIVDFILFAEGALFITLETNLLVAKSYLAFILAPLLLWSIRRTTELQVKVYISREVVLQSTVVIGAGVYLGLLALIGFYIKQFEQVWTPILQIVFIIMGFVLLIAVLMSHSLKTNLKIFIQKNFFANKFDYRVQWLSLTEELGKERDAYSNAKSTLLLSINATKVSLIKCVNEELQFIGETSYLGSSKVVDDLISVLPQIRMEREAIDVNKNKGMAHLKQQEVDLIVPIHDGNSLWGIALLTQNLEEHVDIDWEVSEYLHVVSVQVAHYLFQHEANEQIMENAQFAAFSRMSAFVLHDLKNILAQIQMIVTNAEKHRNNPEFIDDTFETLAHSQNRLSKVIKQLKDKKVNSGNHQQINVVDNLKTLVDRRFNKNENIQLEFAQDVLIRADQDRFINVISHIVDNALQASGPKDKVLIKTEVDYDRAVISVQDTGKGMTEQFVKEKLFKPFETTKGNAGMGIGAYDAKVFAESLGGEVKVTSIVEQGTNFVFYIPREQN